MGLAEQNFQNCQDSRSIEVNYFALESMIWGATGPNPTKDVLNLALYSPTAAPVSIQVYDVMGKRVIAPSMDAVEGGNAQQLDLTGLEAGTYFINLQGADQKLTRKVVKLWEKNVWLMPNGFVFLSSAV